MTLPASALLAAIALPAVSAFFQRGEFSCFDAQQTARSLVWMAIGVWAVASAQSMTRMFYAYGDTRTPVLCSALNLACFVGVTLATMNALGHASIALANSAASVAQLVLLCVLLARRIGALGLGEVAGHALRCCVASAASAFVAADVAALGDWCRGGNDPRNLAVFAGACVLGLAVYLAMSYLLRIRELDDILEILVRRKRKRDR
jgi:putative peptidoglycan lipid II flippase